MSLFSSLRSVLPQGLPAAASAPVVAAPSSSARAAEPLGAGRAPASQAPLSPRALLQCVPAPLSAAADGDVAGRGAAAETAVETVTGTGAETGRQPRPTAPQSERGGGRLPQLTPIAPVADSVRLEAWLGAVVLPDDLQLLADDTRQLQGAHQLLHALQRRTRALDQLTDEELLALLATPTARSWTSWWLTRWIPTIQWLGAHQRLMRHWAHPAAAALVVGVSPDGARSVRQAARPVIRRLLRLRTLVRQAARQASGRQTAQG